MCSLWGGGVEPSVPPGSGLLRRVPMPPDRRQIPISSHWVTLQPPSVTPEFCRKLQSVHGLEHDYCTHGRRANLMIPLDGLALIVWREVQVPPPPL